MAQIEKVDGIEYYGKIIAQDDFIRHNVIKLDNHYVYDQITTFDGDYSQAKRNGLWGILDCDGNEVVPCLYKYLGPLSDDCFLICPANSDLFGFVDLKGKEFIKPQYYDAKPFSEGFAAVRFDQYSLWGFINLNNEMVIPPQYNTARAFSEGLAAVQDDETFQWGYIDEEDNLIIPFMYKKAYDFENDLSSVDTFDELLIIDRDNNVVSAVDSFDYDDTNEEETDVYYDDIIDVQTAGLKETIYYSYDMEMARLDNETPKRTVSFDEKGTVGTFFEGKGFENDSDILLASHNLLAVSSNSKWGLRHVNGKYLTSGIYHYCKDLNQTVNFRYIEKYNDQIKLTLFEEYYGVKIVEQGNAIYHWYATEEQRDMIYESLAKEELNLEEYDHPKSLILN